MKKIIFSLSLIVSIYFNSSAQDLFIYTSSYGYSLLAGDTLEVHFDFGNNGSAVNQDYKIAVAVKNTSSQIYYTIIDAEASSVGVSIPHFYNVDYQYKAKFHLPDHTSTIPSGNYQVIVAVDNDEEIQEISESNNAYILLGSFNYQNTASIGEEDEEQLKIHVYPNPTTNVININTELTSELSFTLISNDGKIVNAGSISLSKQLDVSNLAKGVYALTVYSDNKTITKKVIIE